MLFFIGCAGYKRDVLTEDWQILPTPAPLSLDLAITR